MTKVDLIFLIGAPSLASIAKWQDELEYTVDLDTPGKHVLAVVFFTPEGTSGDTELAVSTSDSEGKYGKTIKKDLAKIQHINPMECYQHSRNTTKMYV